MVVTCGQCIHLMKTTCRGAKGWALFTMEFLEVKIKQSRVLRIGSEIMPGARRFCAHGKDDTADLRREMVNAIWIPRRVFNDLGNGD
jgi:hypothetical protein